MIKWDNLLESYRIPYVEVGPNVARGHINIKCPFCGDEDPSEHMGLNLSNGYWGCWRNTNHRGKSPVRLIRALLHCSIERAREIAGLSVTPDPENAFQKIKDLLGPSTTKIEEIPDDLIMPDIFQPIRLSDKLILKYLRRKRKFSIQAHKMAKYYDLRICRVGDYAGRIIFPVYEDGRLVTWTGRALANAEKLRYKSLSQRISETGPRAIENIKSCLFGYDRLQEGGEVLVITEGPFDAAKLDWYGKDYGLRATCTFGTGFSNYQIDKLYELRPLYKKRILMLDPEFIASSYKEANKYRGLFTGIGKVPDGAEDPGDLLPKQVIQFCKKTIR